MRRLVKIVAFAIALPVLLAGLAVAVFFSLSDAQHRWLATRVVSALLDSPVEFRGPFSLDLARQPTLTARDIWIGMGPDGRPLGAPVEGRLGVVELRVDLGALLHGTVLLNRLVVESMDIELAPPERDETDGGTSWRERVRAIEERPVLFFETVQLSGIRILRRGALGAPPLFLELQEVSLEETGGAGGRILLNGDIAIDGLPFKLQGEFGSLAAARDPAVPYQAKLAILHPAFEATLEGQVEAPLAARGLDLQARLEVPDVQALETMMQGWPWPAGRMSAAGAITGDIEALRLGGLIAEFSGPEGRSIEISGEIADALELRGTSLDLTARLPKAHVVLDRFLETELPALDVSLEARLLADGQSWRADDLDFEIAAEGGWSLAGSGSAELDAKEDEVELDSLALDVALSAPDTAVFSSLAGREIESLGPVTASGTLSGEGNSLEMANLSFRIGEKEHFLLTGEGRVDLTGLGEFADGGLAERLGVDLAARIEGSGDVVARVLLGMDWPDPGPLRTAFQVTGDGRQLRLAPRAFAYDGDSGSALRLGPTDERSGVTLVLAEEPEIRDLRLPLLVTAPGTAALGPWLDGRFMPGLGEMTGRAVLVGGGEDFGLHDIVLTEGPESQPRIKAAGRIDVKGQEQIDLTADFWADLAEIVNAYLTVPLQPLGGVKGHVELSNADGSLGIEMLEVATLKDGDARLRLSGVIDDIEHFAEADLSLEARLARLELVRRAFEPDWDGKGKNAFWQQSASFDGRLLAPHLARFASLEGSGNLGSGELLVDLRLHDLDERPVVNGAISLSRLNLSEFGVDLSNGSGDAAGTDSKWLFPDTPLDLSPLEGASLDLTIAVDEIIDPLVSMQRIDAHLVWNDTMLALQPAVFVYEGGHVNVDLATDFTEDPPAHRLTIVGDDMDLGNFLSRFGDERPLVEGKLTIDSRLGARGSSAREIASSLSGEMAFALENGRLNHANLELLAPDTFHWFLSASKGKSYSDLRCVIAHFHLAEGVAESDSLIVTAPKVHLAGKGRIDLGKEELDITLAAPRPALAPPGLSKPVRFHGSLAAPDVQTATAGHMADLGLAATGMVLMPMVFVPWYAAGFLFSQLDEVGEYSPCLINPVVAQDEGKGAVPVGRWVGSNNDWTLTLTFKGREAKGRIRQEKGSTKITGTVKGEIRPDGIFVGWTAGRQVGGRKIFGPMAQLEMWGGTSGDAASFAMKEAGQQAGD